MPRMIICYRPAGANFRFDWSYYIDHHLPLAVGTSIRHTEVVGCDVAKPVEGMAPDFACICTVHFPDESALREFIALFASHPDRKAVIADQVNYTDIDPIFLASDTRLDGLELPAFRFHAIAGEGTDRLGFAQLVARADSTRKSRPGVALSTQSCRPAFAAQHVAGDDRIVWLDFASRAEASAWSHALLPEGGIPHGLFEMMPFELQRARR